MTVSVGLSPVPILQLFDNTGKPAVGGTLLTQSGGVNYATYSDAAGSIALPNPIPLNSRGEISTAAGASSNLFLQTGVTYTFTFKDASGNQMWSIGNITSPSLIIPFAVATGTNTIAATYAPPIASLYDGLTIEFKAANTTTGIATFNPNGLGAVNLYYPDGVTQISAGAIIQNYIYQLIYNSVLNGNAGGFVCVNPSRVTGSFTITLTAMSATTTGTINYAIEQDGKGTDIWCNPSITGTSNATTMTGTGISSVLQAGTDKPTIMNGVNSGNNVLTIVSGLNTTTWTFGNGVFGGTWTGTGQKGLQIFGFHYVRD